MCLSGRGCAEARSVSWRVPVWPCERLNKHWGSLMTGTFATLSSSPSLMSCEASSTGRPEWTAPCRVTSPTRWWSVETTFVVSTPSSSASRSAGTSPTWWCPTSCDRRPMRSTSASCGRRAVGSASAPTQRRASGWWRVTSTCMNASWSWRWRPVAPSSAAAASVWSRPTRLSRSRRAIRTARVNDGGCRTDASVQWRCPACAWRSLRDTRTARTA